MPFISFEGIDATGKTTQIQQLSQRLQRAGQQVVCTRETGGTPLGMELRKLVQLRHDLSIAPLTEVLLYAADRAQHLAEVVNPALQQGFFVVTDRYVDSSLAFQGAILPMQLVEQINDLATDSLRPDLTVLLDLDVRVSRTRLLQRSNDLDRIETRDEDYQERVRRHFLLLAEREPQRFMVLPADREREALAEAIWQEVERRFL